MTIYCKKHCTSRKQNNYGGGLSLSDRHVFFSLLLLGSLAGYFLLAAGCSSSISENAGGEPVEHNLTLCNRVLQTIFVQVMTFIEPEDVVYHVVQSDTLFAQRYLDNAFQGFMMEKEKEVYQVGPDFLRSFPAGKKPGKAVSLMVQDMKVDYSYPEQAPKSSSKKLSRDISVQVFCKVLHNRDGEIIAAQTIGETVHDFISEEDLENIQRAELPFTVGRMQPKKRGWRDILEIGTVLTAAGTIIYLLFSTRS